MEETLTNILSFGTFIGNILIVLFLLFWLLMRQKEPSSKLLALFKRHGLLIAFLSALVSVVGSLYYSEVLVYLPCKLCWIQRIFMYPQVIILGIALWKKDKGVKKYSITLAVIGACVAVYHYLTQRFPEIFNLPCQVGEASCSFSYMFEFGYISIPIMSLTAFVAIIIFLSIWQPEAKL